MTSETYLTYAAVVGVFFASPPGPSQLLMMANSLAHGVRRRLATVAGDLSANSLQMTAAAFGLAAVIGQSATALGVVKWAGVAYLVWMGFTKLRARPAKLDPADAAGPGPGVLYRQGFLCSAANPKAVVFFAALFPQFIDPAAAIWPQLLILGATYLAVDGVLLVLWGQLAVRSLGRVRALTGPALNRVSGAMLIAAAALLASRDVTDLRGRAG